MIGLNLIAALIVVGGLAGVCRLAFLVAGEREERAGTLESLPRRELDERQAA